MFDVAIQLDLTEYENLKVDLKSLYDYLKMFDVAVQLDLRVWKDWIWEFEGWSKIPVWLSQK